MAHRNAHLDVGDDNDDDDVDDEAMDGPQAHLILSIIVMIFVVASAYVATELLSKTTAMVVACVGYGAKVALFRYLRQR